LKSNGQNRNTDKCIIYMHGEILMKGIIVNKKIIISLVFMTILTWATGLLPMKKDKDNTSTLQQSDPSDRHGKLYELTRKICVSISTGLLSTATLPRHILNSITCNLSLKQLSLKNRTSAALKCLRTKAGEQISLICKAVKYLFNKKSLDRLLKEQNPGQPNQVN